MTETSTTPRLTLVLSTLVAANIALVGFLCWQSSRNTDDVDARLKELEQTVRLMRYESTTPYEGIGFNALLDHLQYWAPWMQKSKPGSSDHFFVKERIRDIVESMAFLPDASDLIEQAFMSETNASDGGVDDEMLRWLLVALSNSDPVRSQALLTRVIEAKDLATTLPLRKFAATELLLANKTKAGEVLHGLLSIRPSGAGGRVGSQNRGLHKQHVFNYIDLYVASEHPEVEKTLTRMLKESEYHETITIQRCVEALGKLESRMAVRSIEKLYKQQAPIPGQIPNPVFRRKCMVAVVEILGKEASEFLRYVDKTETDSGVRAKLDEYRKQFNFDAK